MKKGNSQLIFSEILKDIVNLKMMPGDKISENQIAQHYQVSRTVVRASFLKLEELGFVDIKPKSGTFVTKIDLKYIKAALLIRLSMEKEICIRIMRDEKKRQKLVEVLTDICNEQRKYIDDESYIKTFAKLDTKFHEAIVDGDDFSSMTTLIERHLHHISRWRNITVLGGIGMDVLLNEHLKIIECIEKRDFFALLSAMDTHINKIIYSTTKLDDDFRYYFK